MEEGEAPSPERPGPLLRPGTARVSKIELVVRPAEDETVAAAGAPERGAAVERAVREANDGAAAHAPRGKAAKEKLGTIKGVFVPTMQNILGIILFLRVPFIVGQAGVIEALAIVWLSCGTTMLTSISMSAVATNGVPRGGGCYAMVKNSLGAQFGGVTGTLLFLSNTFGVAMYVLGCVEVLQDCFPAVFGDVSARALGLGVLAGLALIVYVGVSYISRCAVVFLVGDDLARLTDGALKPTEHRVVHRSSPRNAAFVAPI